MLKTFLQVLLIVFSLTVISSYTYSQVVTAITPGSSPVNKSLEVIIRGSGTNFQNGISVVDFGSDITVLRFNIQNPETGVASIQISPAASVGFRNVTVTTGSQSVSLPNGFEVFASGASFRGDLEVLPVDNITLSDLDPSAADNSPAFFFVNVYNNNVNRKINIDIFFSAAKRGLLGRIYKNSLTVAPNAFLKISRKDFTSFESLGASAAFFKEVFALGSFPPDDYTYRLEIKDEQGIIIAKDEDDVTIKNPKYNPELIQPGADFQQDIQNLSLPFPLFQWFGQQDKFDFALYKVLPGQTPEEAVRNLAVYKADDVKTQSLIYPVYAEKLINGTTYAWQVKGKLTSAKGVQALPSEVFRFVYNENAGVIKGVAKMSVSPQEIDLKAGEQYQFNAQVLDENNNIVQGIHPVWLITPDKGSITQSGLFTAGKDASTLAVLAKVGSITDFATVNIKAGLPPTFLNLQDWSIDQMLRKIFGLPPK